MSTPDHEHRQDENVPPSFNVLPLMAPISLAQHSLFLLLDRMGVHVGLTDENEWVWQWRRYGITSSYHFETFGEAMLDALRWYYQERPYEADRLN